MKVSEMSPISTSPEEETQHWFPQIDSRNILQTYSCPPVGPPNPLHAWFCVGWCWTHSSDQDRPHPCPPEIHSPVGKANSPPDRPVSCSFIYSFIQQVFIVHLLLCQAQGTYYWTKQTKKSNLMDLIYWWVWKVINIVSSKILRVLWEEIKQSKDDWKYWRWARGFSFK